MALRLSTHERVMLEGVRTSPGYQVLLDVMEKLCLIAENDHFETDPADTPRVLASHNTARSKRHFFDDIQKEVEFQVSELAGERQQLNEELTSGLEL